MSTPDTAILVAVVGLIAAVLGGFIQALATRSFERAKFQQQAKWELYTQYFTVLGELTFAARHMERYTNAMSLMAQLRGRMGVISSLAVIEAVGDVFRHSNLKSDDAQSAMGRALDAMRCDVGSRGRAIDPKHFKQLMFGSREQ